VNLSCAATYVNSVPAGRVGAERHVEGRGRSVRKTMQLVGPDAVNESAPPEAPRLLTAKEVASFLRIPARKVYELHLPRVELSPRRVRWLESDLRAYTSRCRVAGSSR
jgi:predicted DNA-binding transcriptional regulator AlpA